MATFRDTLETVFRATGADEYRRALDSAAASATKLATTERAQVQTAPARTSAIATLGVRIGALSLAYQGLRQVLSDVGQAVEASIRPFADQEQAFFRMNLVLGNLGRAAEIPGLHDFNRQMATLSGETSTAIASLTAMLASFGLAESELRRATPVILDWSRATGIDAPRAADILASALRNEEEAIQRFGVDIDITQTRAQKLDDALKQLSARFRGGAEAAQGTLIGSLTRLKNSFEELVATVGRLFGPLLTGAIQLLTSAIEGWTLAFKAIVGFLERAGIIAPLGNAAAGVGGGATAAALKGDPAADSQNLARIEKNTKQMVDSIARQVLGGGGLAAGALNIRGLNAALRATR